KSILVATMMIKARLLIPVLYFMLSMPVYAQLPLPKPYAPLAQAIELLTQKKYKDAQHCLEDYIETYPHSLNVIEAQYYVAFCAIQLGRPNGEELFKQFIQQHPHHRKAALAYYQLGNLHFSNHNFLKSIEYYLQVAQAKLDDDTRTEYLYRLAYACMNEKNFDEALKYFTAIKSHKNPYQHAASYYAGYIAYRKADYEVALQDLRRAYIHSTYQSVVPYLALQIYYKQQRFQELVDYIKEVHRADTVLKNLDEIGFSSE
ncbi:MAG: tetratricopeptide repeat protein, partial [Bacteroidota bacterium]